MTAQNRESEKENSGFVFNKGKLCGVGDTVYLGRAKGAFSRVVYHTCTSPRPSCLKAGPIGAMLAAQSKNQLTNMSLFF